MRHSDRDNDNDRNCDSYNHSETDTDNSDTDNNTRSHTNNNLLRYDNDSDTNMNTTPSTKLLDLWYDINRVIDILTITESALLNEQFRQVIASIALFFQSIKIKKSDDSDKNDSVDSVDSSKQFIYLHAPPVCRATLLGRRAEAYIAKHMFHEASNDVRRGNSNSDNNYNDSDIDNSSDDSI